MLRSITELNRHSTQLAVHLQFLVRVHTSKYSIDSAGFVAVVPENSPAAAAAAYFLSVMYFRRVALGYRVPCYALLAF